MEEALTLLEDFNTFVETGVDISSRRIEFNGEINDAAQSLFIRSLIKMSDISSDPIDIYFSSEGGDIYNGLAIYDAMRACKCKIRMFASGKIMSAGIIIFLGANERYATPNTRFMVHSVAQITVREETTKLKDMKIDVLETDSLNNQMLTIIAERTKMSFAWWQKKVLSHDYYFGVNTAIDYGIIKIPTLKKG